MTSTAIRQTFLDFFASKGHTIVPSAPVVIKNDPTLLFTNAGMNQFKDYFLGNKKSPYPRVADTQKCLRVSGKHNDLEEVGVDTYHHTLFEMLGNWSFGDYFKAEAIAWSWELLTEVYKLDKSRLYVTIFEGDQKEGLPRDEEAYQEWKKWIAEDRILLGNKKDNFWEMGDTGPCGPCTEIHYDTRPEANNNGHALVNNDDTGMVMEIWNNVFIQFNRKKDGSLEHLPAKHVDTGMGFERLVRVIQGKTSNYDTDVFSQTIGETEKNVGKKYDYSDSKQAVAFRVIADHVRAIAFTIADGQLPSNTGAGYVIRRILRRAVRYYYSYLDYQQPLLHQLLPIIASQFQHVFPELHKQEAFVSKVIKEEEEAFLRTLEKGLSLFDTIEIRAIEDFIFQTFKENKINIHTDKNFDFVLPDLKKGLNLVFSKKDDQITPVPSVSERFVGFNGYNISIKIDQINADKIIKGLSQILQIDITRLDRNILINGKEAFQLFDTYGFPIDLTKLIANEHGMLVDVVGFEKEMQEQKNRSRAATAIDTEDWVMLKENTPTHFVGYDSTEAGAVVTRYRKSKIKGKELFQLVLDVTPFYAESGGQTGDTGELIFNDSSVQVVDTKKENDLIIHFTETLPEDVTGSVLAKVDNIKRRETAVHHSATHLLHAALRQILGTHVAQKGSLVTEEHLRFDFSHFAKINDEEINAVEKLVNAKIRENIPVIIQQMPKEEALKLGAMALFGEKYGDTVRVVMMDKDYSVELCGGTHVGNTGQIGFFKIKQETAVAAGVRRIEAVGGYAAELYIEELLKELDQTKAVLKNPKDLTKAVENLQEEKASLQKHIEYLEARQLVVIRNELLQKDEIINQINFIADIVEVGNADALKKLCFDLKNHLKDFVVVLCANIGGKPFVAISIADNVVAARSLDAGKIIKEQVAPLIKGGGGGQKTLATAGGQDASNLQKVIDKVRSILY